MGDLDIDGTIILQKDVKKNWMGGRWVSMVQDKWRTLLDMVMNLRVPSNGGNFLNTQELLKVASNLPHEASDMTPPQQRTAAMRFDQFQML